MLFFFVYFCLSYFEPQARRLHFDLDLNCLGQHHAAPAALYQLTFHCWQSKSVSDFPYSLSICWLCFHTPSLLPLSFSWRSVWLATNSAFAKRSIHDDTANATSWPRLKCQWLEISKQIRFAWVTLVPSLYQIGFVMAEKGDQWMFTGQTTSNRTALPKLVMRVKCHVKISHKRAPATSTVSSSVLLWQIVWTHKTTNSKFLTHVRTIQTSL